MLDVVSRTLADRVEAFVQANQLLDRLLPKNLFLVPGLGIPRLRQSFPDRVVRIGPLLYLSNIPEHNESSVGLQRSLRERPQIRLFQGLPRVRSCAQRRKFPGVR